MLSKYHGSRNICRYFVSKLITEYFFHYITCFGDDNVETAWVSFDQCPNPSQTGAATGYCLKIFCQDSKPEDNTL